MVDPDRLSAAYETAHCDLLAEISPTGHWTGQLSSSPLATAAAITALALVERHAPTIAGRVADEHLECQLSRLIIVSLRWLAKNQNADGGWGDSDKSPSNIAATMLVRAAFALTCVPANDPGILERADAYITACGGPRRAASALWRRFELERPDSNRQCHGRTDLVAAGAVAAFRENPLPTGLVEAAAAACRVPGCARAGGHWAGAMCTASREIRSRESHVVGRWSPAWKSSAHDKRPAADFKNPPLRPVLSSSAWQAVGAPTTPWFGPASSFCCEACAVTAVGRSSRTWLSATRPWPPAPGRQRRGPA